MAKLFGEGIYSPDIDEDINICGIIASKLSEESQIAVKCKTLRKHPD